MTINPNTESPAEAFAAFDAWVRTKPADESYDFMSNTNCAYAQFLKETGRAKSPVVCAWDWRDTSIPEDQRIDHDIPRELCYGYGNANDVVPLHAGTFGAIVAELDAMKAQPL